MHKRMAECPSVCCLQNAQGWHFLKHGDKQELTLMMLEPKKGKRGKEM